MRAMFLKLEIEAGRPTVPSAWTSTSLLYEYEFGYIAAAAQAVMKAIIGHDPVPHWMGMPGARVWIHKGSNQGGLECRVLWMASSMRPWAKS